MTTCVMGPEPPGRVRGVSSSIGWKCAWPEFSDMYRKRRRTEPGKLQEMKEEIKAQVTQEIMAMFASQGLQLQPLSKNPSRRSSCASASEVREEENNANLVQMDVQQIVDLGQMGKEQISEPIQDSIF